jgi:hypothetical protein
MMPTIRSSCLRRLVAGLWTGVLSASLSSWLGCSSESANPIDGGSNDAGLPDGYVPIPATEECQGVKTACLFGTVAFHDFKAPPTASRVILYRVFPHGETDAVAPCTTTTRESCWVPVALDGTFAFSDLPAWSHYYLQAQARFEADAAAPTVASVVGSFAVPAGGTSIALVIRPVFLEVLQQASSGMSTTIAWASAHLYDPATGVEVTTGTVSLSANGKTTVMPYGANAGGTESFFTKLPPGTPGGTSFTITTSYAELGSSPVTWSLVGDPVTFQGSLTLPASGAIPANHPLTVSWTEEPMASYEVTELFFQQGSSPVYVSPVFAPDVMTDTIPASEVATPGTYLLNESYANATCPATADGCVYNVWTAAETLTAN